MIRQFFFAAFTFALFASYAEFIQAAAINGGSGLTGPGVVTVNFLPGASSNDDPLTIEYLPQGIILSGFFYNTQIAPEPVPTFSPDSIKNFTDTIAPIESLSISFTQNVNAFFVSNISADPAPITFTALLDGISVEDFSYSGTVVNGRGFEGIEFDEVQISLNQSLILDTLQFTPVAVPEPSCIAVLGILAGASGFRQSRRNRRQRNQISTV